MQLKDEICKLIANADDSGIEIYHGIAGYEIPQLMKVISGAKEIKQMVNGKSVAAFHKLTNMMVNNVIATRVEKGISLKNLIHSNDFDLEIEYSNPEKLKESRILPSNIDHNLMLSIIGNVVTITVLNPEDCLGIVIKNKEIAKSFESIFDQLWLNSKPI
jgi:sugar-specific transcriptional regulator TrmB